MRNPLLTLSAAGAVALAAAIALPAASAQAAGKTYDISGFSRVSSSASVDVIVKRGPFSVTAQSSNGKYDELVLERHGDTLVAGARSKHRFGRSPHFTVTVSAPAYEGFAASSSSSITGENLGASDVDVQASSSANVALGGLSGSLRVQSSSSGKVRATNLQLTDVKASASSSGDIRLSGACKQLEVSVSSSADFNGADLKCETVTAKANSSADADVWASIAAHGVASSSGGVVVHGQPATFDKETSSSGSVRKL
jgi:hypothetical protein